MPRWNNPNCGFQKGNKHAVGNPPNKTSIKKGQRLSPATEFKKGNIPHYKKHPEETKKDDSHYAWKGDNVGYHALHRWIAKKLGRPMKCEHCGTEDKGKRGYHWANKDHKYRRNLKDWIRLCISCHIKYDKGKIGGA